MPKIGKVTMIQVNNNQGSLKTPEMIFLYVGEAGHTTNDGKILTVTPQSDLKVLLGATDSILKTQVSAAIVNAKSDNFVCFVLPVKTGEDWREYVDLAFAKPNDLNVEAVVVCKLITQPSDITDAEAHAVLMEVKYSKFIAYHMPVAGINPTTQTWSEYKAVIKAFTNSLVAPHVAVVPLLTSKANELGIVCGRLCDPSVTIADSPMRNNTGALVDFGDMPVDSAGVILNMGDILELVTARFSCPQWYNGFDGTYWADHAMLDSEGSDFEVYENLRAWQYSARRIRILSIRKIGDRSLNNSPKSMDLHANTYFADFIRDASKEVTIGGRPFPGIYKPYQNGDIKIEWVDNSNVNIITTVRTHNIPKGITNYIALQFS